MLVDTCNVVLIALHVKPLAYDSHPTGTRLAKEAWPLASTIWDDNVGMLQGYL